MNQWWSSDVGYALLVAACPLAGVQISRSSLEAFEARLAKFTKKRTDCWREAAIFVPGASFFADVDEYADLFDSCYLGIALHAEVSGREDKGTLLAPADIASRLASCQAPQGLEKALSVQLQGPVDLFLMGAGPIDSVFLMSQAGECLGDTPGGSVLRVRLDAPQVEPPLDEDFADADVPPWIHPSSVPPTAWLGAPTAPRATHWRLVGRSWADRN